MKNYLWNMFANIKNGQLANWKIVYQENKTVFALFLKILWTEGFILGYTVDPKNSKKLKIFLRYKNNRPVINSIKLVSIPSRWVYYSTKQIWKFDSTKSFIIFSTNYGLKSITNCKKFKIGGEPYFIIN